MNLEKIISDLSPEMRAFALWDMGQVPEHLALESLWRDTWRGLWPAGRAGDRHCCMYCRQRQAPQRLAYAAGRTLGVSAMPMEVVNTAQPMCSQCMAPSVLVVFLLNRMMSGNQPAANIMDQKPMVNILPFGMCRSPANPVVAAATAAALGVLMPMPRIPATPAPWMLGAVTVLLGNAPLLDSTCKLICMWAGVIQVVAPGQVTHIIA